MSEMLPQQQGICDMPVYFLVFVLNYVFPIVWVCDIYRTISSNYT